MTITPSPIPNQLITDQGVTVQISAFDIGPWNMSANPSITPDVGISHSKILAAFAQLIADDNTLVNFEAATRIEATNSLVYGISVYWTSILTDTQLYIASPGGSEYQSATGPWIGTTKSRGTLYLVYLT